MSSSRLTVFYIESPNEPSTEGLINCFKGVDFVAEILKWENERFSEINAQTGYYGLFYTAERLEPKLVEALGTFLAFDFDALVLWKKTVFSGENVKFFTVPRIFKSSVALRSEAIEPESWDGLEYETVLDGWVVENA